MRWRGIAHATFLSCGLGTMLALGPAVHGQEGQAPIAVADGAYLVVRGGTLSRESPGVLANDSGGALSAVLSRGVQHGTLSLAADGSFTYAHDGSATTSDSFSYRASNGVLESSETTATLALTAPQGATLEVPGDYDSIQDAIDAAASGDLILIAPGTYQENLDLTKAVTLASWLLTTGDETYVDTTILDGQNRAAVIDVPSSAEDGATIAGLTIQNADDGISAEARIHLLRNRIRWTKDGVDYEDGSGGTCRYNLFEENDDDGIDPDSAVDIVIEHNVIRNNGGDGIEIRLQPYSGPTLEYVIRHNLIYGNQEDGIQLIGYDELTDRRFEISHNAIYDNVQAGLGMMSGANTRENYEGASLEERILVFGNTFSGNHHGMTGGDNAVVVNNLFVGHTVLAVKSVDGSSELAFNLFYDNGTDAANSNLDAPTSFTEDPLLDPQLRLLSGSPAIDAGTPFYVFQGETVLDLEASAYEGAAPDLGAFEWIPGSAAGPEAPELLLPLAGAGDVSLTPTLRWLASADLYQLQIATTWDFLSAQTLYDVATTDAALEHTVSAGVLDHLRTYFWRVRGSEAGATGSWSEARSFTTEASSAPPGAPTLSAPLPGIADVDLEPTLTWRGAAELFWLQLATEPTFAAPVLETSVTTKSLVPGPGSLSYATTYHWRVRGENSFGLGPWSAPFPFTTRPPPLPLQPPWGLHSPAQTPMSIDLRWASTLDPRVVAFAIYRDGVLIATESEPDHLVVGLLEDSAYAFRVASLDADGNESLSSAELRVWTSSAPQTLALSVPVSRSADDAEERVATGASVTLNSSDLELTEDGTREQIVGLRFRDVDVPGDSPVLGARIQFTSAGADSGATSLVIEAEASDDADAFAKEKADLSSRPTTSESAAWDPPSWQGSGASGAAQRTPELTALVQEIVDRPGWSAGNAMAFLISGSGRRSARAYDGDPDEAAVLELEHLDVCGDDADGDGFVCELDCDDDDASVHPGASEICDGRDNDCNHNVDESDAVDASRWYADFDADGYGDPVATTYACTQPPGWVTDTSDCNDADAAVFPGASEACNGRDDDCDGATDEDYAPQMTICGIGSCAATGITSCVAGAVIDSCEPGTPAPADTTCNGVDDDCDGSVDEEFAQQACATGRPGVCSEGTTLCQAAAISCVTEGAAAPDDAVCNGLDDDCDGATDEDFVPQTASCGVGACRVSSSTSCEAGVLVGSCEPGTPAPADATCDGVDDDCDGSVDEEFGSQSCVTGDPGICAAGTAQCENGVESCEADLQPQTEICNDGLDNDCDGAADLADAASCASTLSLSIRVAAGEDDAEERISSGGSVSLASSSLQLVEDGTRLQAVGLRFRGVDLPQGATIVSARIQFSADDDGGSSTSLTIVGEASDDAAAFARVDGDVTSRPRTSQSVVWTPAPWTSSQASGPNQRTPDLAALVQEIVDRPGWSQGHALVLVISGSGTRTARSYDGTPERAALLELEYSNGCGTDADGDGFACDADCNDDDASVHPGAGDACDGVDNDCDGSIDEEFASQSCVTGDPGICAAGATLCEGGSEICEADLQPQIEICNDGLDNDCDGAADLADAASCAPLSLSVPVASGEDDAEERISSGGSVSLASSSLQLVDDGTRLQAVGLRFRAVDLPQGATIVSARIQFSADDDGGSSTSLTIVGEASDDAAAFARVDGNVTSRPRTSQSVVWTPVPWTSSQASGPGQRTPDLAALVQEIVDRPGWSPGHALVLVISGSGTRTARSYDGSPERAAVLELEYLPGAP